MVVVAAIVWLGATADRTANGNQVVELATMFNPERDANRVRLLIWDAVSQAMVTSAGNDQEVRNAAWRWLVGFGPETTWLALEHSYPAELAVVESWQSLPDRAHNQVLEILLTRGLLGVGCYLLTAAALLAIGLRAAGLLIEPGSTRRFATALMAGSTLGGVAALAASGRWSLAAVGLTPGMVVGALGYLLGRVEGTGESPPRPRRQRWLALLLTAAVVAHLVETQFGIAVTASETYFWLLAGALVALRYRGWSPGDAADAAAPGGTVDGLVIGTILLTLVFGLMTPGTTVPLVVALVLLGAWLGGWVLSSLGMATPALFGRRGKRVALVSAVVVAAFIGFHKLQTATATALQTRGDDLAAASTFATFFDGYQAWMLAATLATGVLLAASKHDDDQSVGDRSPARTVLTVTLILALGIALPRAPHVAAARADILAAQAERARLAGRFASAGRLYQEALSLRADEIVYRIGLAKAQTDWAGETSGDVRDSRFRRAAHQLRLALQSEQAGATEHANMARLYTLWGETEVDAEAQSSRLARADRHYRGALAIRPQSARYYAEWGRLSVLQGWLEPARWRFGRSLALDPTQGQTYLWVRPLLSSDLLEASDALAELGPDVGAISPAQVHGALVEHFIEAGQFEAAIEAALRRAQAVPEHPVGHWTLAGLYSRTGRPAEGLPHARRALQRAQGRPRRQIARLIDNLETAIERTAS